MSGGGYGEEDSNNDGKSGGIADFLTDIRDGGGPGFSGDRFMSGGGNKMDANGDGRISADEYGQNKQYADHNFFSNFSNGMGATPLGSGLDPRGGSPADFLHHGGIMGSIIHSLMGTKPQTYPSGSYDDNQFWRSSRYAQDPQFMQRLSQFPEDQKSDPAFVDGLYSQYMQAGGR